MPVSVPKPTPAVKVCRPSRRQSNVELDVVVGIGARLGVHFDQFEKTGELQFLVEVANQPGIVVLASLETQKSPGQGLIDHVLVETDLADAIAASGAKNQGDVRSQLLRVDVDPVLLEDPVEETEASRETTETVLEVLVVGMQQRVAGTQRRAGLERRPGFSRFGAADDLDPDFTQANRLAGHHLELGAPAVVAAAQATVDVDAVVAEYLQRIANLAGRQVEGPAQAPVGHVAGQADEIDQRSNVVAGLVGQAAETDRGDNASGQQQQRQCAAAQPAGAKMRARDCRESKQRFSLVAGLNARASG